MKVRELKIMNCTSSILMVDGGRQMKRLRTAPQGRGYRIKKRSNHITMILGNRLDEKTMTATPQKEEE